MTQVDLTPYLIGDIHGCYTELLDLEAQIQAHAAQHSVKPLIVSVGDLIDRGPDSAAVVEHFFKGQQRGSHQAILGNHEVMMLQILHQVAPWNFEQPGCDYPLWLWTLEQQHARKENLAADLEWEAYLDTVQKLWIFQGGKETLESYGLDPFDISSWKIPALVMQYLLSLPFYWETPQLVITHALASAEDISQLRAADAAQIPLDGEHLEQLRAAAYQAVWSRELPSRRPDPDREHISGHTPGFQIRHWKLLHCSQIDTACVYGRRLSAYCPTLKASLSTPARQNYVFTQKAANQKTGNKKAPVGGRGE